MLRDAAVQLATVHDLQLDDVVGFPVPAGVLEVTYLQSSDAADSSLLELDLQQQGGNHED
jgi:hypothetical protein